MSLPIEVAAVAATPPTGWTNDQSSLCMDYYWLGEKDDLKFSLDKYYHIAEATPIWARETQFGDVMFIFRARPADNNPQNVYRYYVWNGIEDSVCEFASADLGDIQATINNSGQGKGYLKSLAQTVLDPVE